MILSARLRRSFPITVCLPMIVVAILLGEPTRNDAQMAFSLAGMGRGMECLLRPQFARAGSPL